MVYADHLREEGNKFMSANFHYTPKSGHGREGVAGGGGNYLSVHLRRGDYLYARPSEQLLLLAKDRRIKYFIVGALLLERIEEWFDCVKKFAEYSFQ